MGSCRIFSNADFAVLSSLRQDDSHLGPFTTTTMASASKPGAGKRIVFTGGSGKAGRHVLPYLKEKGYKVCYLG